MSRALEKHIIESLRKGDSQLVFDEIASIFSHPTEVGRPRLEIEFLGQAHALGPDEYYLRDGNAVAIPKLRLIQAFAVARQHLRSKLQQARIGGSDNLSEGGKGVDLPDMRKATSILLLTDPEHLTAANSRKRMILQAISGGMHVGPLFDAERHFVDSLLTSPLHRHSKSPTLWSHRRWLLEQQRKHAVDVNISDDIRHVILPSGERHPRNYYAWSHARWLMMTFAKQDENQVGSKVISDVTAWCLKHHNDISGWSFLLYLLQRQKTPSDICEAVFKETITLTESFQWRNDSVWWFLHALVSNSLVSSEGISVFEIFIGNMFGSEEARGLCDERLLASKWHQLYWENKRHV